MKLLSTQQLCGFIAMGLSYNTENAVLGNSALYTEEKLLGVRDSERATET
jgi:hypothetical protein